MKQPSKQELRERIAMLNTALGSWAEDYEAEVAKNYKLKAEANRATIAANALLATLFVIVVMEVVL